MTAYQYGALAIPVAHAEVMNRVLNQVWSDSGDNLSVRCSATGEEPATYLLCGMPISDAEKATFPWSKEGGCAVDPEGPAGAYSQTEVDAAIDALEIQIRTGTTEMALWEVQVACVTALLATFSPPLQKIVIEI